jgi:hypothetical protein
MKSKDETNRKKTDVEIVKLDATRTDVSTIVIEFPKGYSRVKDKSGDVILVGNDELAIKIGKETINSSIVLLPVQVDEISRQNLWKIYYLKKIECEKCKDKGIDLDGRVTGVACDCKVGQKLIVGLKFNFQDICVNEGLNENKVLCALI